MGKMECKNTLAEGLTETTTQFFSWNMPEYLRVKVKQTDVQDAILSWWRALTEL